MQTRLESSNRRMETLLTQMANANMRNTADNVQDRDNGDWRDEDDDVGTTTGQFKIKLPKMQKSDDMNKFIKILELVPTRNNVNKEKWMDCLVSQITEDNSDTVVEMLMEGDCAY